MDFLVKTVVSVIALALIWAWLPVVAIIAGIGALAWLIFSIASRKWERDGIRRQSIYAAANRAEIEDAQFQADDERGIYGQYPPERLTS